MKQYKIDRSKEYNRQLKMFVPGGEYSNHHNRGNTDRIHIKFAQDCRVWDIDGNEYVDLYNKSGAVFAGHSSEPFLERIRSSLDAVIGADMTDTDQFACELIKNEFACAEMMRFSLSGTEAVQNALRLARVYSKKWDVIGFTGHYHGSADGLQFNYSKELERYSRTDKIITMAWNRPDIFRQYLRENGDHTAAVIMEPICINGGGIWPNPDYLKAIRELCTQYHVVLIFDEVITGVRISAGGAQACLGVVPDLCVLGKSIGNGIPVSVVAGKAAIMKIIETPGMVYGGTFNGYPLGLAAIQAVFQILRDSPDVYVRLKTKMDTICALMAKTAGRYGIQLVFQGIDNGLVAHCNSEIFNNYEEWDENTIRRDHILSQCMSRYGILLSPVLRLYPNMTLSENDIDFINCRLPSIFKEARRIFDRMDL